MEKTEARLNSIEKSTKRKRKVFHRQLGIRLYTIFGTMWKSHTKLKIPILKPC